MNEHGIRENGTRVTVPDWIVLPAGALGAATVAALAWAVLFESGWPKWGMIAGTILVAGIGLKLLYRLQRVEQLDRSVFGRAKFGEARSDAEKGGLK